MRIIIVIVIVITVNAKRVKALLFQFFDASTNSYKAHIFSFFLCYCHKSTFYYVVFTISPPLFMSFQTTPFSFVTSICSPIYFPNVTWNHSLGSTMSGWLIPNIQIRYVMKCPIQFPSHRWSPLYGCSAFCQLPHGLFSQRCFNNIVFFSRVFPWYLDQNKSLLCTIQSFFWLLSSSCFNNINRKIHFLS